MSRNLSPMRSFFFAFVLSVALAGCAASPPARYYTLRTPAGVPSAGLTAAGYAIEVLPVSVPAQVDQPHLVLRTGPGTVLPLLSDRWTSPLGEELQGALSDVLKQELGALDVRALRDAQSSAAVWRIQLDVQRFEMVAHEAAIIDATWRIKPVNTSGEPLVCRSLAAVPAAGEGIAPLVAAQQQAMGRLGAAIAAAIRRGGRLSDSPASRQTEAANGQSLACVHRVNP